MGKKSTGRPSATFETDIPLGIGATYKDPALALIVAIPPVRRLWPGMAWGILDSR